MFHLPAIAALTQFSKDEHWYEDESEHEFPCLVQFFSHYSGETQKGVNITEATLD